MMQSGNLKKLSPWEIRISELLDRGFIDTDQARSLTDMIGSDDPESKELVKQITKIFVKETLSKELTDQQKACYEGIIEYIEEFPHVRDGVVLSGYAGTGKTFLVKRILEYMIQNYEHHKIAVVAPTNKAVKVLFKDSAMNRTAQKGYVFEDVFDSESRLTYSTVHKLLGMKEVTDEKTGRVYFKPDSYNESKLSNYNCIIIDEAYMLPDVLFDIIMKKDKNLKVIFLGDPAQVPPVKQEFSILQRDHGMDFVKLSLTDIMRQHGNNPIVKYATHLRNNLEDSNPLFGIRTSLDADNNGIKVYDSAFEKPLIRPLIKQYVQCKKYIDSADYFKILAYRRETVTNINKIARETVFGENVARFITGERLIVTAPIFDMIDKRYGKKVYKNWIMIIPNSEELTILDIDTGYKTIYNSYPQRSYKCYHLKVSFFNPLMKDNVSVRTIDVIHEDDAIKFRNDLRDIWDEAEKHSNKHLFKEYYDMRKHFASIDYNYALTVHRAQGSTYENVLMLEDDMDVNRKVRERNQIKYTAFTRASKKLFILKKVT